MNSKTHMNFFFCSLLILASISFSSMNNKLEFGSTHHNHLRSTKHTSKLITKPTVQIAKPTAHRHKHNHKIHNKSHTDDEETTTFSPKLIENTNTVTNENTNKANNEISTTYENVQQHVTKSNLKKEEPTEETNETYETSEKTETKKITDETTNETNYINQTNDINQTNKIKETNKTKETNDINKTNKTKETDDLKKERNETNQIKEAKPILKLQDIDTEYTDYTKQYTPLKSVIVKEPFKCNFLSCASEFGRCHSGSVCECNPGFMHVPHLQSIKFRYCEYEQKQQGTAFILEFFFFFGIGHFYVNHIVIGILKFLIACASIYLINYFKKDVDPTELIFYRKPDNSLETRLSLKNSYYLKHVAYFFIGTFIGFHVYDLILFAQNKYTDGYGVPLVEFK